MWHSCPWLSACAWLAAPHSPRPHATPSLPAWLSHPMRRSGSAASGVGCLEDEPGPRGSVLRGPEQRGKWWGVPSQDWNLGLGCRAQGCLHGHSWPWFGPFPWDVVLVTARSCHGHLGLGLLSMALALG